MIDVGYMCDYIRFRFFLIGFGNIYAVF